MRPVVVDIEDSVLAQSSTKGLTTVFAPQANASRSAAMRPFVSFTRTAEPSSSVETHNPTQQSWPVRGFEGMDMSFQAQFPLSNTGPWPNQTWMPSPQDPMSFPAQSVPGLTGPANHDFFNGAPVNRNSTWAGQSFLAGPNHLPEPYAPLTQSQPHTTLQQTKPTFITGHHDPVHRGSWDVKSPCARLAPSIGAPVYSPYNAPNSVHCSSRYRSQATNLTGCAFEK